MQYLTGAGIVQDKLLTQMAMGYRPSGFIADKIFPQIGVNKQFGSYMLFDQGDFFRVSEARRSPGTLPNLVQFQVGSATYACENFALANQVTKEDRLNAEGPFIAALREQRASFLVDQLMLGWDYRVASLVTNPTNVGSSTSPTSSWSDHGNTGVLDNVWQMIQNISDGTGYRPNKVVFGPSAWRSFARNAQVIDKVRGTGISGGGQSATTQLAAALLEVDEVMVGYAQHNTSQEGQGMVLDHVWGDNVLAYYAPPRASIEVPSFGYSLRWTAAGVDNMNVMTKVDEEAGTEKIWMGYYQDEVITSKALGGLLIAVNSSH